MVPKKMPNPRPSKVDGQTRRPSAGSLPPINGKSRAANAKSARTKTAKAQPGDQEPNADEEIFLDKEEPEEPIPTSAVEDWGEINLEEPLDLLDSSVVALELSEDPVRLYFKEIGQINLLDADSEFRLAARIEALRLLEALQKHVPSDQVKPLQFLFNSVVRELITSWGRLVEDAHSLQQGNVPDLSLTLAESQMLRRQWQADEPSYLRTYLDNGMWGKDTLWDGLVRHAFTMFICMYLLPGELAEKLLVQLRLTDQMPELELIPEIHARRARSLLRDGIASTAAPKKPTRLSFAPICAWWSALPSATWGAASPSWT